MTVETEAVGDETGVGFSVCQEVPLTSRGCYILNQLFESCEIKILKIGGMIIHGFGLFVYVS